jgi:acyl dehydratase
MVIGIKYCGGCNPTYDRVKRVKKFMAAHTEHKYQSSFSDENCDYLMVVCGCSRRCVDTTGLKAGIRIVILWDEESFWQFGKELKAVKENKEIPLVLPQKNLHLHEKVVQTRNITSEDAKKFAELTGDESRLHLDLQTARQLGYDRPLIHGMFVDSLVSAVMGTYLPGNGTLYMEQRVRFIRPVFLGDTLEISVEFVSYEEMETCYIGVFHGICRNQNGKKVLSAHCSQMMRKELFLITDERE